MAFHCAVCNASLNSSSQWTQHVSGSKHQQKLLQTNGASGTDTVVDELASQEDGNLMRCSTCPDFFCYGWVPFNAHVVGKRHLKNVLRYGGQAAAPQPPSLVKNSVPPATNSNSVGVPFDGQPRPAAETVETVEPAESIRRAWGHRAPCAFALDDDFAALALDRKVRALSPHFAFVAADRPLPDLRRLIPA